MAPHKKQKRIENGSKFGCIAGWVVLFLACPVGRFDIRAEVADSVIVWGDNTWGQANLPIEAQSGVIAVAAGDYHTLALKTNGSVVGWGGGLGGNYYGQAIVPPEAQSGVIAISAGGNHSLALKADGSVVAWGDNGLYQSTVPAEAKQGVSAIAAGGDFSLALKRGSVIGWGYYYSVPAYVGTNIVAIAAGRGHALGLRSDGSVVGWGSNSEGQARIPTEAQSDVIAITATWLDSFVLKKDGSVISWGFSHVLGYQVPEIAKSGVVAIAAGPFHALAIKSDGTLISWELYGTGQLSIPKAVKDGVFGIAAGAGFSVAIIPPLSLSIVSQPGGVTLPAGRNGTFRVEAEGYPLNYQWFKDSSPIIGATGPRIALGIVGAVDSGKYTVTVSNQLGFLTSQVAELKVTPALAGPVTAWGEANDEESYAPASSFPGLNNAVKVCAGFGGSVALTAEGELVLWGGWSEGPGPVPAEARSGMADVSLSYWNALALRIDGRLIAWGSSFDRQNLIPDAARAGVRAVAAGETFDMVLKEDHSVSFWGWLGQPYPWFVLANGGISAIAACAEQPVLLTLNGGVFDPDLQLPVATREDVIAVAAGKSHAAALKADGSVIAWGSNDFGQINVPDAAKSSVVAIAANENRTIAVKFDGTIVGWGDYVPPDEPLTGVTSVSVGLYHNLALRGAEAGLAFRITDRNLILSWPAAAGYTLQSKTVLDTADGWIDAPDVPPETNGQSTVSISLSASARFYRLRK